MSARRSPTLGVAHHGRAGGVEPVARRAERGLGGGDDERFGEAAVGDAVTDEGGQPALDVVRGVVGDELVGEVGEPFDLVGDERLRSGGRGGEVPVQGADAHAGATGDLVERRITPSSSKAAWATSSSGRGCVGRRHGADGRSRCQAERTSVYSEYPSG